MTATIAQICEDIKLLIDGADLTSGLTLVTVAPPPGDWIDSPTLFKGYLARYGLQDFGQIRVSVLPASYENARLSRDRQLATYGVDIVAQLRPVDEQQSDALYGLADEISDEMQYAVLPTSGARWLRMEPATLMRSDELEEIGLLTTSTRHLWIV